MDTFAEARLSRARLSSGRLSIEATGSLAAAPAIDDLPAWEELGATAQTLRGMGYAVKTGPELRDTVRDGIGEGGVHPKVLTAAAELGLVDAEAWRRLVGDRATAATRELDDTARQRLVSRIGATWRAVHGTPVAATQLLTHWLDQLGRGDLVPTHHDAVRSLLPRQQVPATQFGAGGFGEFVAEGLGADALTTHRALMLLQRFDLPAAIDREVLQRYLRGAEREAGPQDLLEHADHAWFDRDFAPPRRSPLRFVRDERLLFGAMMLVVLCLVATLQAPVARPVAGPAP